MFRKVTDFRTSGGKAPSKTDDTLPGTIRIDRLLMKFKVHELKFDQDGLIPAIVQDANTREVLTLAYMNAESVTRTMETKETWFWSRSRNELWHKGETSGNTQHVVDVFLDCDQDALVVLVEPAGPACHTGERTCFHNAVETDQVQSSDTTVQIPEKQEAVASQDLGGLLDQLYALIESRKREQPAGSYTTYLFKEGLDKILKKLGEESAETIIAAKNEERQPLVAETSDLLYHLLVVLVERGITLDEIQLELRNRQGKSSG